MSLIISKTAEGSSLYSLCSSEAPLSQFATRHSSPLSPLWFPSLGKGKHRVHCIEEDIKPEHLEVQSFSVQSILMQSTIFRTQCRTVLRLIPTNSPVPGGHWHFLLPPFFLYKQLVPQILKHTDSPNIFVEEYSYISYQDKINLRYEFL